MATHRTSDFSTLLGTPLRKLFYQTDQEVPTEYSRWCNVVPISKNFVDDHKISGLGAIPEKSEGNDILFEDVVPGDTKRYTPKSYALGFTITWELWQDQNSQGNHNVFKKLTASLKRSFRHLFETEAARIFNYSTDTSSRYLGIDSLALLSTAHTLSKAGGTYANKPSTDIDISYSGVQTAMTNMHATVNDANLPEFITPKMFIVSGNDMFNAAQIFRNAGMEFGTTDNNKNFVVNGPDGNGFSDGVFSRYFTDTDMWFILSDKARHSLNLMVRQQPDFKMSDDFRSGNILARGFARVISGFTDWRGVYGSTGAA